MQWTVRNTVASSRLGCCATRRPSRLVPPKLKRSRVAAAPGGHHDLDEFSYLAVAGPPMPEADFVLAPNPTTTETNLVPQRQERQLPDIQQQNQAGAGLERRMDKREYREQAAMIQAQAQEIGELRTAVARMTKERHLKGMEQQELLGKKDKQLAALYNIAADASRERGVLRQTVAELEADLQMQKQQLYAIVDTLSQIKDGLRPDELAELHLDQWTYTNGQSSALATDNDVFMQLHQMQNLGQSLMEDAIRDEQVLLSSVEDSYDGSSSSRSNGNSSSSRSSNGNGNGKGAGNGYTNGNGKGSAGGRFSHWYSGN